MLPSKEKFHYYPCPFYLAGNCDRPFCHFKHADVADASETDKKSNTETEEKCPSSCPCNSQDTNRTSVSNLTTKVSQNEVPQYKPTPISELQKRNSGDDNEEDFKFNFLENESSKSYSPNGFNNLSLTYNPTSTLNVKQEYGTLENDFQEYRPSPIDLNIPESIYGPESKIGILPFNFETLNHEYSPSCSSTKSKLLYSPGPPLKKPKLEYDPSQSVLQTNLNFQLKPIDTETLSNDNLNYVPTTISNKSPIEIQEKNNSSSKSHKSSSRNSDTKRRSSSSDNTKNKHKSHSSKKSSSMHSEKKESSSKSEHSKNEKSKSETSKSEKSKSETSKSEKSKSETSKSEKPKSEKSRSEHSKNETYSKSEHSKNETSKSEKSNKSEKTSPSKSSSSKSSSLSKNSHKSHDKHKSSSSNSRHHSSSKSNNEKSSKHSTKHKSTSSSKEKTTTTNKISKTKNSPSHHEDAAPSSDESSRDVLEECYRIFEAFEYDDTPATSTETVPQEKTPPLVEEQVPVKRRIAHDAATTSRIPSVARSSRTIRPVSASAGQMLTERWKKQQAQYQKEKEASTSKADKLLSQLVDEPKPTLPWLKKNNSNATSSTPSTVAQSSKGKTRVAHKAKEEILRRPIVAAGTGDRIPVTRRQHALDKFTDSCLNIYHTTEEAFEKAIELEKACFEKSLTHTVYNNLFVNSLLKLKHTTADSSGSNNITSQKLQISLERGCIKKTVIHKTNVILKGAELHKRLQKYMLTEEQLKDLSFPVAHESMEEGRAQIFNSDKGKPNLAASSVLSTDPNLRECTRCRKLYVVDKHGMPPELDKDNLCTYHPKRAFKKRIRNFFEYYYDCCSMQLSHNGCEKNKYHVTERFNPENLTGFVTTVDKGIPPEESGVYALDCEMCITTEGSEVTRVTIINENGKAVYDALVKPDRPILDYNTKFSGITESMMTNVRTTLRDVQRVLLNMFSQDTILIGHSLNGDLQVLKIIHKAVVDTSIVYPHREGLPKRRALKNLAIDHLSRLIQMDDAGHSSEEDALTCMDLMLLKLKEDVKLE